MQTEGPGMPGTQPETPRSPRRVFSAPAVSQKVSFASSKPQLFAPGGDNKSLDDARSRFLTGPLDPAPSERLPGRVLERLLAGGPARIAESLQALKAESVRSAPAGPPLPSGNPPSGLTDPAVCRWNWGAFLGGGLWALSHRMLLLGLLLLLFFWTFPLPNILMGRFGGQMAWRQRPFADLEQYRAVQGAWTRAGVLVVLVHALLVASPGLLHPRCVAKSLICLQQTTTFCALRGAQDSSAMLGPDTHTDS